MTTRTTIHCDRCGADVTDANHWQFGLYEVATLAEFAVTKGNHIDLCDPCKRALDRFLNPTDWSAMDAVTEEVRAL
jgi:hypothetical protein